MILSLEQSVPEHLRGSFKYYFVVTITAVTTLYIVFGGSGYLSFGPETMDIITLNLPHEGGIDFAVVVKLCLCIALFFTYPVMLFPVTSLIRQRTQHYLGCADVSFFGASEARRVPPEPKKQVGLPNVLPNLTT